MFTLWLYLLILMVDRLFTENFLKRLTYLILMKLLVVLVVLCSFAAGEDCNENSRKFRAILIQAALTCNIYDNSSEVKFK